MANSFFLVNSVFVKTSYVMQYLREICARESEREKHTLLKKIENTHTHHLYLFGFV